VIQSGDPRIITAVSVASASVVAAAALLPATRPWRGRAAAVRPWGAPLALGLAVCAGFVASRGWPAWPPSEALHRLFYVALCAGAYGLYEAARRSSSNLVPRAVLVVLAPYVVLEFQRRLHWSALEGAAWMAGLAAVLFVTWQALVAHEARERGGSAALGLALATALSAATQGLAGGTLFFLLPASLALATGASALLGLWRRDAGLGPGGVAPFVILYSAFAWLGHFLNELSTLGFVLLALAPLAVWLSALAPAARPRTRAALAVLGPTLVAALALAHEFAAAPPPSPYG